MVGGSSSVDVPCSVRTSQPAVGLPLSRGLAGSSSARDTTPSSECHVDRSMYSKGMDANPWIVPLRSGTWSRDHVPRASPVSATPSASDSTSEAEAFRARPEHHLRDDDGHAQEEEQMLSVIFNQDNSCFACGTTSGFRVFSCASSPLKEFLCRASLHSAHPLSADTSPVHPQAAHGQSQPGPRHPSPPPQVPVGGVQRVEMLYRSNLMALVGGGPKPRFPSNKVVIWDDDQGRCVGELVFRSEVRGVRLRRDRVAVLLECKIYIYCLVDLRLLGHVDTLPASHCARVTPSASAAAAAAGDPLAAAGPGGSALLAISQAPHPFVLACLGLQKGQVRVEHLDGQRSRIISAHESCIAALALTADGTKLATASVRGTLARIYNTADGTMLQELRRGADRAEIYCLAFSPQGAFLALTSDKGTAHVFAVTSADSCAPLRTPSFTAAVNPPPHAEAAAAAAPSPGKLSETRGFAAVGALSCSVQAARTGPVTHPWPSRDHSPISPLEQPRGAMPSAGSSSEATHLVPGHSHWEGGTSTIPHLSMQHPQHPQQQRRLHSPHHPLFRHPQPQVQWQRLRQSQSCPPRRWVADGTHSSSMHEGHGGGRAGHSLGSEGPQFHEPRHLATDGAGEDECSEASEHSLCNPGSSLSFMRGVLPRYFSSEWSVAQFRHLPRTSRSIVAFGHQKHTLLVVTQSGRFFRLRFNPVHGGEMVLEERSHVFHLDTPTSREGGHGLTGSKSEDSGKDPMEQAS